MTDKKRKREEEQVGRLNEVELASLVRKWQAQDEFRMRETAMGVAVDTAVDRDAAAANGTRLDKARARLRRAIEQADGTIEPDMSPTVPYDPERTAAFYAAKPVTVAIRQMQLVAPLAAFLTKVILDVQRGKEEIHRQQRAEELTSLISSLGPAVIKAGQALSSRSDLLPAEYLKELSRLQDRVPPFANEEAFAIVERELGRPIKEMYKSVQPQPVAAASLGQVYRATLHDGREVALKVQRPNCDAIIALDLHILRAYSTTITSLIKLLGRDVDLVSVIDDFGTLIYAEIDYRVEANNAVRFRQLYGMITNVSAPEIIPALSTRRVLTMEWINGIRLTDRKALIERGLEPAQLVETLVQCSLRQMLEIGFFHADPHAGNLLVTDDGKLTYIDFGMMSFLQSKQRYAIIEAVVHLVNRDFGSLAVLYKRLGFIPEAQDVAPIVFALESALPDVLNASVSELNFKSVIDKLGDVMYEYPFSLPPFYIAIIRCLLVLEGVALQVDQEFAIIKDAYPYIAARLLTDRSPELQRAFQQLVFKDGELRWDYLQALIENAGATSDYDAIKTVEQLSDYLLSPTGEPLLQAIANALADELDTLGAESALYVSSVLTTAAAGQGLASQSAAAAAAAAASAAAAATGAGVGVGAGMGASGSNEPIAVAIERISGVPLKPSMLRAINLLDALVLRSASTATAAGATIDVQRVGRLAAKLLASPTLQRTVIDLSLQLTERALQRGLRFLFSPAHSDDSTVASQKQGDNANDPADGSRTVNGVNGAVSSGTPPSTPRR